MRRVVAAGLVVLAVAACSAEQSPVPPPEPAPTPPTSVAPTTPAPPQPTGRDREPITIAVAGDVHFEGVLGERLRDPETALAPATTTLAAADLAIVNLETSIGRGGRAEPGQRYAFQAPPTAIAALVEGGIDVVSMANNHAVDFGRAALDDTFAAFDDTPLAVVGLGRDADEAFRPAVVEVGDTTVATLGASIADTDPTADPSGQTAATGTRAGTADAIDPTRLLRAVGLADTTADVVVAYLHWGVQGEACPDGRQRALARRLVDAGADLVVGSHAHRLQGDGRLGPGYVAYGLGNYAWYTQDGVSAETGVLTLTVRPPGADGRARVTDARWSPARIGADGLPAPLPNRDLAAFASTRSELRACAGLVPGP
jgi:poly-gamma-glutamate synthesis protein (capsule biosynthesis protein)